MDRWIMRIGYVVVAISLLCWVVPDLLPVDLAPWVYQVFFSAESKHAYLRVVPSDNEHDFPLAAIFVFIGVVLIFTGYFLKIRRQKK